LPVPPAIGGVYQLLAMKLHGAAAFLGACWPRRRFLIGFMSLPRPHRALSLASAFGYRGKLVALAAMAAACPLAVLAAQGAGPLSPALAAAAAGTGLALVALAYLLRPIHAVASGLSDCAGESRAESGDEAVRMVADMRQVAGTLEAMRHRLSHRHPVTGMPTREPFLAALSEHVATKVPAVLGVIRFTDYDDLAAFDQDRADRALKAFAERLAAAVQPGRPTAQVDRDCFAIWFPGGHAAKAAAGELQAIGYVLAQDLGDGDLRIAPDVSLGAAVYPTDAAEPAALLTRAFAAAPKAGRSSSGRLSFFSAEASEAARERFQIEQGLRTAISRDQFALHYQPVFDSEVGAVVGAEALLRWRHPELGMVPPVRFIPVLEQSGMMEEVGLWVLNAACRQARAWEDQGLNGLKLAVNLSARQCRDPSLAKVIVRTLDRHGLRPESLELELTETAAMEDADRTRALLGELRDGGIGVAIDDFGAGYSSLSYLKNLPFSKLKIDREFVDRVDERRDSQAICAALVELSRRLDITVLSEGVERREEVDTLQALGCAVFQGYFFSPPLPAAEFAAKVTEGAWPATAASARRDAAHLEQRLSA
jgi:EAL domain-containing protein (putative c-di-GMP-specific phosphodiesterase class I)/GGDEF domain-containing protein